MTRGPVVFDGGVLAAGPWTGVARAFLSTLEVYAHETRCTLLLPPDCEAPDFHGLTILRSSTIAGPLARRLRLPPLLRRLGARLLHSPVTALPLTSPCPTVATVHDLPWRAPVELHEAGCGLRYRLVLKFARRHAAALLVPSQCTATDLRAEGPSKAVIHVVPHGLPLPDQPAALEQLRGPLLAFGDARPRKNLDRLRVAWRLAHGEHPGLPPLRIVGPGIEWIDEADKAAMIRQSTALLAFSLHEGFGLPLLEAFGHGLPTACSDCGSLAEIAQDATLCADPLDVEAMAEAMIRISSDQQLRATLRRRGLRRAAEFSPEQSAAAWHRIHAECGA